MALDDQTTVGIIALFLMIFVTLLPVNEINSRIAKLRRGWGLLDLEGGLPTGVRTRSSTTTMPTAVPIFASLNHHEHPASHLAPPCLGIAPSMPRAPRPVRLRDGRTVLPI